VTTEVSSDVDAPEVSTSAEAAIGVATYNAFAASLELAGIELVKIHGERTAPGAATQTRFDLAAGYTQDSGSLQYRYDVTAHFLDKAGIPLGNASASALLVAHNVIGTDAACIEHFGATSGALMAHPYLREVIASTAQRIGFPGVLLPMIKYQPDQPCQD
jgi:hypothetical protein